MFCVRPHCLLAVLGLCYHSGCNQALSQLQNINIVMNDSSSLSGRTGYSLDGFPGNLTLVFVRASIAEVCDQLSSYFVPPKDRPPTGIETRIFQFKECTWTGLFSDVQLLQSMRRITAALQVDGIILVHDDCSSWTSVEILNSGTVIEECQFGPTDDSEKPAFADGWDVTATLDGEQFLFRSTTRQIDIGSIKRPWMFLDHLFSLHGLWVPNWKTLMSMPSISEARCIDGTIYW